MDSRCSFKAFGVILLHFKVDKMNWGVIFTKKKKFEWGTPTLENPEIAGKTRTSGFPRKFSSMVIQLIRATASPKSNGAKYHLTCQGLMATSVTKGGTQKLPKKFKRLLKHIDMTIHWKF
jgi:hypothetical protein